MASARKGPSAIRGALPKTCARASARLLPSGAVRALTSSARPKPTYTPCAADDEFVLASLDACVHPLLITAHDAPLTVLRRMPDPYRAIRALMALKVRKQARNLTAVTPYLAARWRSEMRYRNNIAIITNPMPSLDASKQSDSGKLVVLDVANASRLKNVRTLIRAFALVVDGLPNAELRLVGPGLAQRGEMDRWAASRDFLDRNVRFIGNLERSALANEYESATVLCHPSREESQGIVLLEAMQAGLPIIAGRDSGAVAWTLFDGEAGTLVDANNPNELARAILSLHNGTESGSGEKVFEPSNSPQPGTQALPSHASTSPLTEL